MCFSATAKKATVLFGRAIRVFFATTSDAMVVQSRIAMLDYPRHTFKHTDGHGEPDSTLAALKWDTLRY